MFKEGLFGDLQNRMLIRLLKLCGKFAPESSITEACLGFLDAVDLGDLETAPYYFTKEKVAMMMSADLKRLPVKKWYEKWWGLLANGSGKIAFNPKDYPNINFNVDALKGYNGDRADRGADDENAR